MRGRHDLTDAEWAIISPLLPNKPRGVPRVDDRRVIRGIFHILRTGTLAGISSSHRLLGGACPPARCGRKKGGPDHAIGRSRGGLSTKIHVVVDGLGLPCPSSLTALSRPGTPSPTAAATPAPSSNSLPTMAFAPTFRPNGIAGSGAWCPITCTANATSSDASSTSSSTSEASRPAITSSQETSSPQSPSPASASGSKSMSTRPRPNSRRTRIQLFAGAVHARLDLIFSRSCTLSEISQRALKSRVARSEAVQEGLALRDGIFAVR